MNERIDRIEQSLDPVAAIVQQMAERAEARLQQHDLELDDHDERVEKIERLLTKYDGEIDGIKDIQRDIRALLQMIASQMMASRLAGEPPAMS
jgi:DNA repair ATPase RecN